MSSAGTVSVKITAQEAELRAELALARTDLANFNAEVRSLSASMVETGKQTDAAMVTQLRAATAQAGAASKQVGSLETDLKKMNGELGHSHGSISTATREFRALFDELSSGRTRMTPGTLAIIGQRVFGLSLGTLAAVGGVVALAAGLGYLVVKAIDADNALQRLKIGMDFEGIDVTKSQLKSLADDIGKDGETIIAGMGKIADSASSLDTLSRATEMYAAESGEKTPAAIKAVTEAMTSEHLTLTKLKELFPGVSEVARENFLEVQRTGDSHKTAAALVGMLDDQMKKSREDLLQYRSGWIGFGNDTRLVLGWIQTLTGGLIPLSSLVEDDIKGWTLLTGALKSAGTAMGAVANWLGITTQVQVVQANLLAEQTKKLDGQTAALDKSAAATAKQREENQAIIASALKAGDSFDTEGRRISELTAKLAQMQKALATPGITKNESSQLTKEIADAQRQLHEANKRAVEEEYQQFVAKEDAKADASKRGSEARIAADTAEVEKAKQLFGSESTEYFRAVGKLNEARRTADEAALAQARKAGEEEIGIVREKISEINADESLGGAQRNELIQAAYKTILAGDKLTADQRVTVERDLNNELASEHKRGIAERQQIDRSNASSDLEIARIGFQQQKDILAAQVSENRISKGQELADLISIAEREGDAEQAALTRAQSGYAQDSVFFIEKENEKRVAAARTGAEIDKINAEIAANNRKTALESAQSWRMAVDEITSAERSFVDTALSQRGSFMDAVYAMTSTFIKKELADDLAYYTKKELLSAEAFAADSAHIQGGLLVHVIAENQKTASSVAGNATRLASSEAATTTAAATEVAVGSASILNDAHRAAAGAYAAIAGIPYVGPFLAPAAAATAYVAVAAFDSLTAFDEGAWNIPRPMLGQLHAGETIVPQRFAEGLRQHGTLGGGGGGSTTNHFHANYQPTVNAPEQKSLHELLEGDSATMIGWFQRQLRSGALKMRS